MCEVRASVKCVYFVIAIPGDVAGCAVLHATVIDVQSDPANHKLTLGLGLRRILRLDAAVRVNVEVADGAGGVCTRVDRRLTAIKLEILDALIVVPV